MKSYVDATGHHDLRIASTEGTGRGRSGTLRVLAGVGLVTVVLAAVALALVVLAVVVATTFLLRVALFLATLGPRFFVTRLALALLLPGPLTIYAPCAPRCRSGPVPGRPVNLESRQVAMAGLEQQVPRCRPCITGPSKTPDIESWIGTSVTSPCSTVGAARIIYS